MAWTGRHVKLVSWRLGSDPACQFAVQLLIRPANSAFSPFDKLRANGLHDYRSW